MVIPILHPNLYEINFLRNHPLGPKLSLQDIAIHLKMSEREIEEILNTYDNKDYGSPAAEIRFLETHPLGPKYSTMCSPKIGFNIIVNFFVIAAYRVFDQIPLLQKLLHSVTNYFTEVTDAISTFMTESANDEKNTSVYLEDSVQNTSIDVGNVSFVSTQNMTEDAWTSLDMTSMTDDGILEQIAMWKKEFLDIFPVQDVVDELYDSTMTVENHQMNMILAGLEAHLAAGNYQLSTSASILNIRAKHYRGWFVKVFPVHADDFLMNMVYNSELTLERHINMMRLAIRTKYW